MNIILISNKLAKARTLNIWQIVLLLFILMSVTVAITWFVIYTTEMIKRPKVVQQVEVVAPAPVDQLADTQKNLDAYAKELGELQARMMRLDAQNERLEKLAGESDQGTKAAANEVTEVLPAHRGGPLVSPTYVSEQELKNAIDDLVAELDAKDIYQSELESKLLSKSVLKDMLPNISPVKSAYRSSSFGWRIDPIRRVKAFHEGLDFPARTGTPIYAAGDGVVTSAKWTNAYGKLVKINHGSGLETRYAHASKLLVKPGERVVKGQVIAKVGSTGRSTGPHLHYEIRLNGSPLDPRRYLGKKAL